MKGSRLSPLFVLRPLYNSFLFISKMNTFKSSDTDSCALSEFNFDNVLEDRISEILDDSFNLFVMLSFLQILYSINYFPSTKAVITSGREPGFRFTPNILFMNV